MSLNFFENYPYVALTRSSLFGIVFLRCKVFEIVKVGSTRAFFPALFLPCTGRSRCRHSRRLVCLLGLFTFTRIACLLQL